MDTILQLIESDLTESPEKDCFWYLYGAEQTSDAYDEKVRPNIMIRYATGLFLVQVNFADADFALGLDEIVRFEQALQQTLEKH